MILRYIVLLLVLANVLFWAWSRGALRDLGWQPVQSSEPQRMERQVHPEAVVIAPLAAAAPVAPDDASAAENEAEAAEPQDETQMASPEPEPSQRIEAFEASERSAMTEEAPGFADTRPGGGAEQVDAPDADNAAPADFVLVPGKQMTASAAGNAGTPDFEHSIDSDAMATMEEDMERVERAAADPTVCLQAGPFDKTQAQTLRNAAATLPDGSWQLRETAGRAPRWMVYLGNIGDELAVLAKRNELHAQGLDVDRPGAEFQPGLSLGRYSTQAAAERALQYLRDEKGVGGTRVVQERAEDAVYFLRAENADGALRRQLQLLPLAGQALRPCS